MFEPQQLCRLLQLHAGHWQAPARLDGGALVVFVLHGGSALLGEGDSARALAAGEVASAAEEVLLQPTPRCEGLLLALDGLAARQAADALAQPLVVSAALAPPLAAAAAQLQNAADGMPGAQSALCYGLLCALADAAALPKEPLPALVQNALALIQAHYAEMYGVQEVADALGVSKAHLVRSFSAAVGTPPGRYLFEVRIQAAKALLCRPMPLEAVAAASGFSGANYLCRAFKKATGLSPAAWRRAYGDAGAPPAPGGGAALPQDLLEEAGALYL